MAFLEKLVGKKPGIDIDEFLNSLDAEEEDIYEDADAFVKPISLQTDADRDMVIEEAKKGNIILLNIGDLRKRNAIKLRELVEAIKDQVHSIDGDIAMVSQDRALVTPSRVKIVKRKEGA